MSEPAVHLALPLESTKKRQSAQVDGATDWLMRAGVQYERAAVTELLRRGNDALGR
ncbi:hypothetical protein SALBM311S_01160 [Streptomyces alboniger]